MLFQGSFGDLPEKKRTDLMVWRVRIYGLAARIRLCESIFPDYAKSAGAGSQHYAVGVLYRDNDGIGNSRSRSLDIDSQRCAGSIGLAGSAQVVIEPASSSCGPVSGCPVAHDKSGVAAVEGVKYTENQQIVPLGQDCGKQRSRLLLSNLRVPSSINSQIAFMGTFAHTGLVDDGATLRIKDAHITGN